MSNQTTIADRLKAWRALTGLTQDQAARKIGVPTSTLSRWEQGNREPKGLYRKAIERHLRASESAKT